MGVREQLEAYVAECMKSDIAGWGAKPNTLPTGEALINAPPERQAEVVVNSFGLTKKLSRKNWKADHAVLTLRNYLLRRKLPFSAEQALELARALTDPSTRYQSGSQIATALERYVAGNGGLPSEATELLRLAAATAAPQSSTAEQRKLVARLNALTGEHSDDCRIEPGEAWSDAALADLEAMSPDRRTAWIGLLDHCQSATTGKPSAKWLKEVRGKLDAIGESDFVSHLVRWFPLVDKPRTQPLSERHGWSPDPNQAIIAPHADLLKGLAWCCALVESKELARALTSLAISSYRKIPQVGPRLIKVGNAAVYGLGNMPGRDAIAQLALLKVKLKFGTAQKEIDKSLTAAAEREGLPRDEVEEMAIPAYGMTNVGLREEPLGDYTARLAVSNDGRTVLTWLKPDGKPQKSVPAAVKTDFAEDLKELKAAAKDIEKMLGAQRERIDTLYLDRKSWPLAVWRERYLDHPLVGLIARKLIWRFTTAGATIDAIWSEGSLIDVDGQVVDPRDEGTTVSLWHPIGEPVDRVLAWRRLIEDREIQQPFKQAHREVYLLTDAERTTRTYSNRYAAHLLKQHQFNALCGVRGWKNKLRLMVDDVYPPATKLLPGWGLRAEYWVEGAGDEYGRDTLESGAFLYLATDQVRFYHIDAADNFAHAGGGGYGAGWGRTTTAEPLPLEEIPPLAFSEVMRDVDLFVGVASVGNDPNWSDGGPAGRYRDYWTSYSFGDLSATAQTRKAVLERLIPRLKIADRCSFSDRFLVVRGKLRTYKIHLGSSNILMEPNDRYLCIVPKSSGDATTGLYLPFEGDRTLSIVLSKALLLADDDRITDPTIVQQIRS